MIGSSNDGVELVVFDAGGVLLLPDADRIREVLRRAGVDADVPSIDRAHYAAMRAVDRALEHTPVGEGGLTSAMWETSLRQVYRSAKLRALGFLQDCPPFVEHEVFQASWARVAPGAIEALRAIAAQQRPIAIVSNANGTVEAELRTLNICQVGDGAGTCVAAIIDSTVVGVAKPDPAIFRFALDAAGVPPERAVFIGDSIAIDLEGGTRAGIRAVHFDPYDLCDDSGHEDIRALSDITTLIGPRPATAQPPLG